jgi:hypothetical protein
MEHIQNLFDHYIASLSDILIHTTALLDAIRVSLFQVLANARLLDCFALSFGDFSGATRTILDLVPNARLGGDGSALHRPLCLRSICFE